MEIGGRREAPLTHSGCVRVLLHVAAGDPLEGGHVSLPRRPWVVRKEFDLNRIFAVLVKHLAIVAADDARLVRCLIGLKCGHKVIAHRFILDHEGAEKERRLARLDRQWIVRHDKLLVVIRTGYCWP